MMPRYRMRMAKRPIHSIKHVVTVQQGVTAGGVSTDQVVLTKDAPVLANTEEVITGSTVNAIFLDVSLYVVGGAGLANAYMIIYKNPGGNLTNITPNTQGANDNKRYVIHTEMVMLQQSAQGNPRTLFKGVIRIPKGFRRFGPNDSLTLRVQVPGVSVDLCFLAIYKEYR